ncbi:MAG: GLPGLI family protein [Ferruginibacter sp.]
MKNFILLIIFLFSKNLFAADTTYFSCKYKYIQQKDSTNTNSKADDVMILTMNNSSSLYYSYLRQLGNRNRDQYLENIVSSGSTEVNLGKDMEKITGQFFLNDESAVMRIDYTKRQVNLTDKFSSENTFGYVDNLNSINWKIETTTDTILGQKCQMATTTFKGRNYIAWFAPGIPYNMGPWLFNGLPGLILKIADDKKQFLFECIELNTPESSTKVFKPYENVQSVSKKKLREMKRLYTQNYMKFTQQIEGKTITATDPNGKPLHFADKPYNPIDLTEE